MFSISVTPEEAEILREILKADHDSLLRELSRTDSLQYKDVLRPREALVSRLLEQLTSQEGREQLASERAT
jgi:hypothetical protein